MVCTLNSSQFLKLESCKFQNGYFYSQFSNVCFSRRFPLTCQARLPPPFHPLPRPQVSFDIKLQFFIQQLNFNFKIETTLKDVRNITNISWIALFFKLSFDYHVKNWNHVTNKTNVLFYLFFCCKNKKIYLAAIQI